MTNEADHFKKYHCCLCGEKDSKRKYEKINILSENGDSIFSPEHEIHDKNFGQLKGQLYFSADLVVKVALGFLTFHKEDF